MPRSSNKDLVDLLKRGDRQGCSRLMDMYYDRLVNEAVSVFNLPEGESEELVSDCLVSVVQEVHTFEFRKSDGDFHFWVMTIFKNRVRDFVRQRAKTAGLVTHFQESNFENEETFGQGERDVIAAIIGAYEEATREESTSAKNIECRERLKVIEEVLESMEVWERVLLRCRALEVPYEDITRYTGKPASQLKVYHGRVKKKFIKLLAVHYPEVMEGERSN